MVWPIILIVVAVVVAYYWMTGSRTKDVSYTNANNALEILKERYAKGEITDTEYKKMRKELE